MTGTCPTCGGRATIHTRKYEDDHDYEAIGFSGRELNLLQRGLGELAKRYADDASSIEMLTLRTRVLELAFMEVSRDA